MFNYNRLQALFKNLGKSFLVELPVTGTRRDTQFLRKGLRCGWFDILPSKPRILWVLKDCSWCGNLCLFSIQIGSLVTVT